MFGAPVLLLQVVCNVDMNATKKKRQVQFSSCHLCLVHRQSKNGIMAAMTCRWSVRHVSVLNNSVDGKCHVGMESWWQI